MGIPLFFQFWRRNFVKQTRSIKPGKNLPRNKVYIDNLLIDLNGPIHNAAQRVFRYGEFARPQSFLVEFDHTSVNLPDLYQQLFTEVCRQIDQLLSVVCPKKRVVICIDGTAPSSKQSQQRKRRYKSASEASPSSVFDSNAITPGTKFMDDLARYIDWHIRRNVSTNEMWKKLEVIFSSDRTEGEGEHKCTSFMRKYGDRKESFCINGCDADLIMLALATHFPNMYILRENPFDANIEYFCLDIGNSRNQLADIMKWDSNQFTFNKRNAINDFIFLCFLIGNDFLPHILSIEIIENGIELMLQIYREIGVSYGHITAEEDQVVRFNPKPIEVFLAAIGTREKEMLESKLSRKDRYLPDEMLESCASLRAEVDKETQSRYELDIDLYKKQFISNAFGENPDLEKISHDYLEGMAWVFQYYLRQVPSWKWLYPHHYAPPASVLCEHVSTFKMPSYGETQPNTPFQQLLTVLPPKSAHLLPNPLNTLLTSDSSPLHDYCPEDFKVDCSGKRKEWEGIVLLPMVEHTAIAAAYDEKIDQVSPADRRRDSFKLSLLYTHNPKTSKMFRSQHGAINPCRVDSRDIEL